MQEKVHRAEQSRECHEEEDEDDVPRASPGEDEDDVPRASPGRRRE
jgi:hypothetical protein